ncbi:hypothetical protein DFJ73DRAFT_137524 [Zopfochytrium polystomum]|nr:hypothetical protein DFJ73DRAFT_137524 [Zopfochytrium polystomum]
MSVPIQFKVHKKIKVAPSKGFDHVVSRVSAAWGVATPTELEYRDTANGQVNVLSADEDLDVLFTQNYAWELVLAAAPTPGSTLTPLARPSAVGDDHDEKMFPQIKVLDLERRQGYATPMTFPQSTADWTALISPDWKCRKTVRGHPFFIHPKCNYLLHLEGSDFAQRQACESHVARELFHNLRHALIKENVECLSDAEKWGSISCLDFFVRG